MKGSVPFVMKGSVPFVVVRFRAMKRLAPHFFYGWFPTLQAVGRN
jgi:hypothetical protein